ncbi:lipoprotein insertase outer membrane protein LolB [Comamonas suwonensis]|uniref:Outer-membrane lipoprotein LolB n=1 Tax=Comamonas suwonensis TaxID=2606214 RepID=A0A843BAP0_9BURK|nr:lipoprotein insertase outer membrane protein LolB [Comamonas suwonensis]MBI1625934.1 outer membrane lipoprotein LolB [Comamonas suwonensis]
MKPMTQLRKTWLTLMMSGALLTGCALPERQLTPDATATSQHWSGRMALQVQDSQQQSFSAGFELQGRPENGTLLVFNPLGSIIARLQWTTAGATLQQGEQITTSDSLPELITRLTGNDIPVAALFDWLQGKDTTVTGWQTDLSRIGEGRLRADRSSPPPEASLRIVLDQESR